MRKYEYMITIGGDFETPVLNSYGNSGWLLVQADQTPEGIMCVWVREIYEN